MNRSNNCWKMKSLLSYLRSDFCFRVLSPRIGSIENSRVPYLVVETAMAFWAGNS